MGSAETVSVELIKSKRESISMLKDMSEQDFYALAEVMLIKLYDDIEVRDKDLILDTEYSDGILNIVIEESGKSYVINRHCASQKIWYSSPISGADYFFFDNKSGKWLNDKAAELQEKLFDELSQFIAISI